VAPLLREVQFIGIGILQVDLLQMDPDSEDELPPLPARQQGKCLARSVVNDLVSSPLIG